MGAIVNRIGWVVVSSVLLAAATIFYFGITGSIAPNQVAVSTDTVVNPAGDAPPVAVGSIVVGPAGLAIPVAGVRPGQLVDTYTQARAGGARRHDAIDIMAATGTPVVSAAPGRVEKLYFSDGGGGISAYVRSDDGLWNYYYAHLSAYAPGLREGQRLHRGSPVGYVGFTGNANPEGPHLHFAVNRMAPGEKWYQGTPINPYPLLAGNAAKR
jgi:murein DD-endopeptidase MepM/ murein hydrolase activator NlpD